MTFCLYECLRAVGLQQHYARFTSAGVCRAAHLSELTIEDYPHLGICTMEERARLFDLVQMIKRNKFKPDADNLPFDHHLEESFNSAITRGTSMHNSDNILLSRCASFQNPNPRSTIVSSETSTNKTPGPQNRKGISRKQSLPPDMKRTTSFGCMAKPTPVFEVKAAANYNYGLPLKVPHRITVCVRKRPLTRVESRRKESDVVTAPSGECVIVHESKDAVDLSPYILEHRFYFDHVFDERNSNEDVYQNTAYPLVQHMLNGGNATCFAYGQTGAGKTHTMLGSPPGRPGLYALAVRDIFTHLSATRTHPSLQVFVSFFEIYCGQLYDLLDHRKRLFAREDGQKMVHISGLRHVRVDSVNSLLEVISHGTKTRTQGMSGVNPCSSRSHALLQIQLRNSNQQIAGRMWFVDLAGSERASDTKEPDKQSRMEGAEINQSLLALKECIRALDRDQSHTPFRQSKLTQVLKNAFIGDSMTCMIANISPGHGATEHTLNTLRYADRKWIELRRRVESSRDINSKEEKELKRDFQDFDGSSEERKMHLRRYHEALQKFIPSTSSSFHLETPSPQTSISSSIPLSFLRHSSSLSVSANGCSGPEEYLDTDAVGGEVRTEANRRPFPLTTGEFHSLNESAPVQHYNHSETRCEQVRGESQKKLGGATGDKRVPKRSAGTDIQHRRLAWDATQQKDPVNVTTILTNLKAQVSDSNDSEDRKALGVEIHNASYSPADGMCSAKQEAAAVVSGCGLFSHTLESTPQQDPAERPLSPACEQTNTFSTSGKLSDVCLEFSNAESHWEQLKEMDALCHKEGLLLHQQPDMGFGEYVHRLEEIMEKKAQCVHSMRAQLQPYLKTIISIMNNPSSISSR
uniref:Kinesin-like protein n=1 Tax=Salarias fasciatus TaxID=181472 RepID=A0A672G9Q4_SALFA